MKRQERESGGNLSIRYLGSKRRIADVVTDSIHRQSRSGRVIDAFAGMGHVSAALTTHQISAFDASQAAATVLTWRLCSRNEAFSESPRLSVLFEMHLTELAERFSRTLEKETLFLHSPSLSRAMAIEESYEAKPGRDRCAHPFSLIFGYFGNSYFGVRQAMELDALQFALRRAHAEQAISDDDVGWGFVALLATATHLTNGPGHFAQFFSLTEANVLSIARLRTRSIWRQWRTELERLVPAGTPNWRRQNRVKCGDSLDLLSDAEAELIFADPPYTASQYSRFYHLLDTLILYDYPACEYSGRYREGRFKSRFCGVRTVVPAFRDLINSATRNGAVLYVTYPSNGLLDQAGVTIAEVAQACGAVAERVAQADLVHAAPGRKQAEPPTVSEELWRIYA